MPTLDTLLSDEPWPPSYHRLIILLALAWGYAHLNLVARLVAVSSGRFNSHACAGRRDGDGLRGPRRKRGARAVRSQTRNGRDRTSNKRVVQTDRQSPSSRKDR
eukprot:1195304-Prorocentrum_minimum.AAC.8